VSSGGVSVGAVAAGEAWAMPHGDAGNLLPAPKGLYHERRATPYVRRTRCL